MPIMNAVIQGVQLTNLVNRGIKSSVMNAIMVLREVIVIFAINMDIMLMSVGDAVKKGAHRAMLDRDQIGDALTVTSKVIDRSGLQKKVHVSQVKPCDPGMGSNV